MDTVLHRWLRIPYLLFVRYQRMSREANHTYVFVHGLGDTAELWKSLIDTLPDDSNYMAADLLGFGKSPKPHWAQYKATTQARSLLRTCRRAGVRGPVTVVGHSLGSLVAVEVAKRYPWRVKELILCSPPIYNTAPGHKTKILQQDILHKLYAHAAKRPKLVMDAYALGKRLKVINQSLEVTPDTLPAFMASLQASIVNQNTLRLIETLTMPITIIDGLLDILTVNAVLRQIVDRHPNMALESIPTGHAMNSVYQKKILRVITAHQG